MFLRMPFYGGIVLVRMDWMALNCFVGCREMIRWVMVNSFAVRDLFVLIGGNEPHMRHQRNFTRIRPVTTVKCFYGFLSVRIYGHRCLSRDQHCVGI